MPAQPVDTTPSYESLSLKGGVSRKTETRSSEWTGCRRGGILSAITSLEEHHGCYSEEHIALAKRGREQDRVLAQTLEPLAKAGADLGVVMGYRLPGNDAKAAIEVYPVSGNKVTAAAATTGLTASSIPTLLVEGDNRPGLAHKIVQTIAAAGADLSFFVAQAIGRRYSAVIGFATEDDAKKAAALIKKAAGQ